jgi:hypothetical protein
MKKNNKTGIKVKDEEKIIAMLFHRPLESLRIMYRMDGELKADVVKKVGNELGIAKGTARGHIKPILEANFFTQEENLRLYRNDKLFKWLWSYFLPLYSRREREYLETTLSNESTKSNMMALKKTEMYAKRIENAIRDEHGHEIDGKVLKKVAKTVRNTFGLFN